MALQKLFAFMDALTIGSFENMIKHYDHVINCLNDKFGTIFYYSNIKPHLLNFINSRVEKIAQKHGQSELQVDRPSSRRQHLAESVIAAILQDRKMLKKTQSLYAKYFV